MKNLRKLTAFVVLTFALAQCALGGATQTPPCADPAPGQTETPPCATQLICGDMTTLVPTSTPAIIGKPAGRNETLLTQIAAEVLLNFVPLFS